MARHHLVLSELDGQIQRHRAVALDPLRGPLREPRNKLLQHHLVDDIVDAGHPAAPSSVPACGWAGPGLLDSPRPEPPGPSSSGAACGPPAGSGRGTESSLLVCPHVHQRFMVFLVESRERLDDLRKRRSRW